jgi:hypothetical protein
LYEDFVDNYPDYGPRSRMTVSRQKFWKWIVSYAMYTSSRAPEEGRDMIGKWLVFKPKEVQYDDGVDQ